MIFSSPRQLRSFRTIDARDIPHREYPIRAVQPEGKTSLIHSIEVPCLLPIVLFSAHPTISLIRVPVLR